MTLKEIMAGEADFRHACAVWREALRLNLSRPPEFDRLTAHEVAEIYNGYGPDSWPSAIRKAVTQIYDNWEPLAVVHDVDFHLSDGTRRGWLEATARWGINATLALSDRYPMSKVWLWPARAVAWGKLRISYRALQAGSWGAWVLAAQRREKRERERA